MIALLHEVCEAVASHRNGIEADVNQELRAVIEIGRAHV